VHPYIPLLAVNPTLKSLGFGTSIVGHLIDEAAILSCQTGGYYEVLFLDVYVANERAIRLYERCGFTILCDEPILDPLEGNEPYIVMAKRVSTPPPAVPF
jgi:ribosomal protein S18 acetylase RimI-like enzyme